MQKVKYLLLIILSFLIFNTNVFAATNPYGKWQTLHGVKTVRCTYYAWQQAYTLGGVVLPGWGNAQTWYASAKKAGYSVGQKAKANSIAVYSSIDGYGHVAYVVETDGNKITVNEAGVWETISYPCEDDANQLCYKNVAVNGDGIVDGNVYYINSFDEEYLGDLIGFIYLDDAPKKTSNSSSSSSSSSTKSSSSKSKNNKLKSLTLDVKEINFTSDTYEYYIEVEYATKIVEIQAEAEDDKTRIEGAGAKALSVGENIYTIKAIAENGDILEYTINITRNEKDEEDLKEETDEVEIVKKQNDNIWLYVGLILAIIIIIIISLIIVKKCKKNSKNIKLVLLYK